MTNYRKPGPGRFGTHPVYIAAALAALTANATTTDTLDTPFVKALVSQLCVQTQVVPADADGTILATVVKWDKANNAAVPLTAAFDLKTLVAKVNTPIPLLAALSAPQLTLLPGDTLYVAVVNNSAAIDTQPVGLKIKAELFILA